jgi:uncharacterized protein YbbK (DUF523 family)
MSVLVSSCLLGIECRYDGNHSLAEEIAEEALQMHMIPVCPEQLGGLSTPRPPAVIVNGDGEDVICGRAQVINERGQDVTKAFLKGARESLALAKLMGAHKAFLKAKSPSCGLRTPYCDSTTGYGMGVTAALLLRNGVEVIEVNTEEG